MIPNRRWFPLSLQERAAWYKNFAAQLQAIGPGLGISAGEIAAIVSDGGNIQFLASAAAQIESYKAAVAQYRKIFTEGDIGDPTPAFPANFTLTLPDPSAPTGAFERLDKLVRRIRVAPAYTNEAGALLGILPTGNGRAAEAELKPSIQILKTLDGYKFSANVTRLGMSAFKVQFARAGDSGIWHDAKFATTNPVEISIPPTTEGQPERILVRAVLLQRNEPVGQPGDPTYVTVLP